MDSIRKIGVLFVLAWCMALCSHAQVVHITGSVTRAMKTMDGGKQNTPVSIPVYIFDNYTEAERQAREYRTQSMRQGAMQLSKVTILPLRITKGILRLILLREERCSSLTKELRASSR